MDYRPLLRAALHHLDNWVTLEQEPPGNRYPRHDNGTIIEAAALAEMFENIPGASFPKHHKIIRSLDFGPNRAVPSQIPPRVGDAFPAMVSSIDSDGNEIGGVRLPSISVPLATFAGWNVRHADIGGQGQVLAPGGTVVGSAIPLPVSREDRIASGDPGPQSRNDTLHARSIWAG